MRQEVMRPRHGDGHADVTRTASSYDVPVSAAYAASRAFASPRLNPSS